jgi:transcriptional regulator CtsR
MDEKKRFIRLLELYINGHRGYAIEQMYGKGTTIRIHNVIFSPTQKSVVVEAVIILGDVITEDVLDRELADVLIQDAIPLFFSDYSVKTMVRWDV